MNQALSLTHETSMTSQDRKAMTDTAILQMLPDDNSTSRCRAIPRCSYQQDCRQSGCADRFCNDHVCQLYRDHKIEISKTNGVTFRNRDEDMRMKHSEQISAPRDSVTWDAAAPSEGRRGTTAGSLPYQSEADVQGDVAPSLASVDRSILARSQAILSNSVAQSENQALPSNHLDQIENQAVPSDELGHSGNQAVPSDELDHSGNQAAPSTVVDRHQNEAMSTDALNQSENEAVATDALNQSDNNAVPSDDSAERETQALAVCAWERIENHVAPSDAREQEANLTMVSDVPQGTAVSMQYMTCTNNTANLNEIQNIASVVQGNREIEVACPSGRNMCVEDAINTNTTANLNKVLELRSPPSTRASEAGHASTQVMQPPPHMVHAGPESAQAVQPPPHMVHAGPESAQAVQPAPHMVHAVPESSASPCTAHYPQSDDVHQTVPKTLFRLGDNRGACGPSFEVDDTINTTNTENLNKVLNMSVDNKWRIRSDDTEVKQVHQSPADASPLSNYMTASPLVARSPPSSAYHPPQPNGAYHPPQPTDAYHPPQPTDCCVLSCYN